MGHFQTALRLFEEVEPVFETLDNLWEQAWFFLNRADVFAASGQVAKAGAAYELAEQMASQADMPVLVNSIRFRLGLLALRNGELATAAEIAAGFSPATVLHDYLMGSVYLERALAARLPEEREKLLVLAMPLLEQAFAEISGGNQQFRYLHRFALFSRARLREALGEMEQARRYYRHFFEELFLARNRGTSGLELAFFSHRWQGMIGTVMESLRDPLRDPGFRAGLELSERSRAAYLIERLTRQRNQQHFEDILHSEIAIAQERAQQNAMRESSVNQPRAWAEAAALQRFELDLDRLTEHLQDRRDTLILVYALYAERSYLWMLDHAGIRHRQLPAKEHILGLVESAKNALQWDQLHVSVDRLPVSELKPLSDALLEPIDNLADYRRLVVIADGGLSSFPLRLLPLSASPDAEVLGERFTLSHAPSLTYLDWRLIQDPKRSNRTRKTMAIIGNAGRSVGATGSANGHHQPPLSFLPSVGQEISQIAALARQQNIQVTVFRGAAANRDNLIKQEWRDVDILHVAAHAQPARREVSEAAILLAPDEDGGKPSKLTLEDILQLDLSADLVVLSGCSTAEGINLDGEGTLSLGWACLAAGAGSVVVSLWPVPDNVTAKLMADFYHYWLVRGVDSAEALRSAQKEMSKRRYGHDYRLFSAFIHLGDGLTEPKMVPWRTSNKAQAARP